MAIISFFIASSTLDLLECRVASLLIHASRQAIWICKQPLRKTRRRSAERLSHPSAPALSEPTHVGKALDPDQAHLLAWGMTRHLLVEAMVYPSWIHRPGWQNGAAARPAIAAEPPESPPCSARVCAVPLIWMRLIPP